MWNVNVLKNHAVFFQDKFQVTTKLTLNYGVRFDQYNSSYPEQRFGLNGNPPRRRSVRRPDGHAGARHRDVQHRGSSSRAHLRPLRQVEDRLEGQLGQIRDESGGVHCLVVNPIDLITKKYAWDNNYLTADPAVAATRITPAYVATLQPILGGAQLTPSTVDPNLKDSYTDDFTLGAEQEIAGNLRGYVTFVRKQQKNTFGRYDRLRTASNTRRSRPSIRVPTASSTAPTTGPSRSMKPACLRIRPTTI